MENEFKLPLAVLKQIAIKYDSVLSDLAEVIDSDIEEEDKFRFVHMKEITEELLSYVYTIVQKEIDEESFHNQYVEMDEMENLFDEQIEI